MNAEEALFHACHEWRRLAKAENVAIRNRDWDLLLNCQGVVKKLQPKISQLVSEVRAQWRSSGADFLAREKKIHALFSELFELGQENKSRLAAARELALWERREIEKARQNLKRLQQSYVPVQPADWISFS